MTGSNNAIRLLPGSCPLGRKEAKAGKVDDTIFDLYSSGYKTGRDAYTYSFGKETCATHAKGMVDDYTGALHGLEFGGSSSINQIIKHHSNHLKWDGDLKNNLRQKKSVAYSEDRIRRVHYRPFVQQYGYVDTIFAQRKYQQKRIFPCKDTTNRVILPTGNRGDQAVLRAHHRYNAGFALNFRIPVFSAL